MGSGNKFQLKHGWISYLYDANRHAHNGWCHISHLISTIHCAVVLVVSLDVPPKSS